jgi:hypothetical protein
MDVYIEKEGVRLEKKLDPDSLSTGNLPTPPLSSGSTQKGYIDLRESENEDDTDC